jgi:RimJ/RimL family protein N-acetyltransferase
MAFSPLILPSVPTLTVTATPTVGQMKTWWNAMQQDPARHIVYTDFMPHALDEFLAPLHQGALQVYLFLVGDAVGGAYYLHDWGFDTDGQYAWLGTYILLPYRGQLAAYAWGIVRQACAQAGLHRIFAAIRAQNRLAQRFIIQQMGFTRLGKYTDWSYFEGRLDHVVLYTLRRQDQSRAWVSAEQRAQQFRCLPRPVHVPGTQLHALHTIFVEGPVPRQALTARQKQAISTR